MFYNFAIDNGSKQSCYHQYLYEYFGFSILLNLFSYLLFLFLLFYFIYNLKALILLPELLPSPNYTKRKSSVSKLIYVRRFYIVIKCFSLYRIKQNQVLKQKCLHIIFLKKSYQIKIYSNLFM